MLFLFSLLSFRENVEFSTVFNRPSKFEIYDNFPIQSAEVIKKFSDQLDDLRATTDLSMAKSK